MATFSKILVPFDGSDPSKRAASKAIDLAKEESAELIGLKVISFMGELITPSDALWTRIEKDLHDKARAILDELVSMAKEKGLEIKTEIGEGEASTEVIRYAEANNVDLIVIGYGGRGGMGKFLGGNTKRLMKDAPCPVMVVN